MATQCDKGNHFGCFCLFAIRTCCFGFVVVDVAVLPILAVVLGLVVVGGGGGMVLSYSLKLPYVPRMSGYSDFGSKPLLYPSEDPLGDHSPKVPWVLTASKIALPFRG